MNSTAILESLNERQREAAGSEPGASLVLAGAGSGKTRVLVHRIAYLIQHCDVPPSSILAVTFTNKAAAEMRERIQQLILGQPRGMWVGTFHAMALRLLRMHYQEAGLDELFEILDAGDQLRLVKRTIGELNLDEKRWPQRAAAAWINSWKDEGLRPENVEAFGYEQTTYLSIYDAYQKACGSNRVDFGEMLLRALELLRDNPRVLEHYQRRFTELLVDEFQDTNAVQYAWLRLLSGDAGHIMVVGDDDQSIYGWRGARSEHINKFHNEYAGSKIIRLEQNYRSTSNILKTANELINWNENRMGKELWTDLGDGDPVWLFAAFNDRDEAHFVAERLLQWSADGNDYGDAAVFYRSNAQSRVLEHALNQAQIPYRIHGGHRFFEREEIRHALAYMQLIANRDANSAFERVVNMPSRGIGPSTLESISQQAQVDGTSLWQSAVRLASGETPGLKGRAAKAVAGFIELIEQLAKDTTDMELGWLAERVIIDSGLVDYYGKDGDDRGEGKVENLRELVTAMRNFDPWDNVEVGGEDELPGTELEQFLSHASLEAGEGVADAIQDCVQLMTMHSAKGLEFPLVFLTGMEDGLFPNMRSIEEGGLEEERRLCYVGVTRAMRHLYLTYAESRQLHGRPNFNMPSRFLNEMPREVMKEVRQPGFATRPTTPASGISASVSVSRPQNDSGFELGQRVHHPIFGTGVVTGSEGGGSNGRLQIQFEEEGSKWLDVTYAKLIPAE